NFDSTNPLTASFQSGDVVASTLGTVNLSGVNPTPTLPSTVVINGTKITIPPALLALADFGIGFRKNGGAAGHLTVDGKDEQPTTGTTPTEPPAFFYEGLNG